MTLQRIPRIGVSRFFTGFPGEIAYLIPWLPMPPEGKDDSAWLRRFPSAWRTACP